MTRVIRSEGPSRSRHDLSKSLTTHTSSREVTTGTEMICQARSYTQRIVSREVRTDPKSVSLGYKQHINQVGMSQLIQSRAVKVISEAYIKSGAQIWTIVDPSRS